MNTFRVKLINCNSQFKPDGFAHDKLQTLH